jgi:hypothetical protein
MRKGVYREWFETYVLRNRNPQFIEVEQHPLLAELDEAVLARDKAVEKLQAEQAKRPANEDDWIGPRIPEHLVREGVGGIPAPRFALPDLVPQPVSSLGATHRGERHPDADELDRLDQGRSPQQPEPEPRQERLVRKWREKQIAEGKILTREQRDEVTAYMDDQPRDGIRTNSSPRYLYHGPMGRTMVIDAPRPKRRRHRSFHSLRSSLHRERRTMSPEKARQPPPPGRFYEYD